MPLKTEPIETPSNSFMRTLGELQKGKFATEASEELARCVAGVIQYGRPGEFVLKLKIRPNADGETVEIVDSIDMKVPKKERKATNFFALEDGQLLRNDPKQTEMFTSVDGGAGELEEVPIQNAAIG